jgi:uncharacterized protein involved in exopolysaccharide biosynthesis
MTESAWAQEPRRAAPAQGAPGRARPAYATADIITLLWRERILMLVVFIAIVLIGVLFALTLKTVYPAQSSLLVRLGQEYVYQPRVGDAARGAVPESDSVIQAEVEILSSAQVKEKVIDRIGIEKLFPDLSEGYAHADPDQQRVMMGRAVAAMAKGLKINTSPGAPVVRLTYEHPDPIMAARVLNTLLEEYLVYRRGILLDSAGPLEAQRKAFEDRLNQADQAYENFLGSNNIGDFEAEKASLSQLQASLEQQKLAADAQLKERQGRLAGLQAQSSQVAPEIGLYRDVDHAAQDKLTDLRVQREALLSRYKPDAAPVHELDVQIAGLQKALGQGTVQGDGARRIGVNPVYQTLMSDRIQLAAEIAALKQSSEALAQQVDQVTERQLRLAQLEPQYQGLTRDRDVLQNNVRDFTVKEQESQAASAIARSGNDNISIIERAVVPTQGKSWKKPVVALAVLLGAFTALCAGLVRMFLRPGMATASIAGRTLGLPVLASFGRKSDAWL